MGPIDYRAMAGSLLMPVGDVVGGPWGKPPTVPLTGQQKYDAALNGQIFDRLLKTNPDAAMKMILDLIGPK